MLNLKSPLKLTWSETLLFKAMPGSSSFDFLGKDINARQPRKALLQQIDA